MIYVAKYGCATALGVIGAVLAFYKVEGWGWFVFIAAMMVV